MNIRSFSFFLKKNIRFLPLGILFILSLMPVIYTWGRLAIGGDIMIPFYSDGLQKYLYQWISINNGQYFSINYYPFYIFYRFTEVMSLGVYQASLLMLFLLNVVGATGIYKLSKLFYDSKKIYLYIVPITFYLLSPALLNAWHYLTIYSFIPWFFYISLKIIKNNEIRIQDLLWFFVILFFSSAELPNPKYLFYLIILLIIILFYGLILKFIQLKFFYKNWKKIVILTLLSLYLVLPLGFFSFNYSSKDYGIHIKDDYRDVGKMMDTGSATTDKMLRLHLNNMALNTEDKENYNNNPVVVALSYLFIVLIILSRLLKEKSSSTVVLDDKYEILLLILICVFLFFAIGPNPPFGFIYEYIVSNIAALAFLRTTAGAVFFLSVFYATFLFIFVNKIKKAQGLFVFLILLSTVIVGYPFLNGSYFKNLNVVNSYTNRTQRGFIVPDEYMETKKILDQLKIDAKVLNVNNSLAYMNTNWGYFGPSLYKFLYNNYLIGYDQIYTDITKHNIKFVLKDNSLLDAPSYPIEESWLSEFHKNNILDIEKVNNNYFLPHFYVPDEIIIKEKPTTFLLSDKSQENNIRLVQYYLEKDSKNDQLALLFNKSKVEDLPTLEFKKINPVKYRIRVHNIEDSIPLVFSENFHKAWKIYLSNYNMSSILSRNAVEDGIKEYKTLNGNEGEQASVEEIKEFISSNLISTLGDKNKKIIKHNKYENNIKEFDYTEEYLIDFISKNFQGTIQNDNLPKGSIFETWFKKPIENNENHLMANGYANSWIIDSENICETENSKCVKNSDGTYNMELVVEFWPQRLFYIGAIISGATLLACIMYLLYNFIKEKKLINKKIIQ